MAIGKCCSTCKFGRDEAYDFMVFCKDEKEMHHPGFICQKYEKREKIDCF